MKNKKQLKNFFISIFLTLSPILIYVLFPIFENKYFDIFSGNFMYLSSNYYFSLSPSFILDLPYFLPLTIWIFTILFCLKIRKEIQNRKSFFNYFDLALIVLNVILLLFSLWLVFNTFLK